MSNQNSWVWATMAAVVAAMVSASAGWSAWTFSPAAVEFSEGMVLSAADLEARFGAVESALEDLDAYLALSSLRFTETFQDKFETINGESSTTGFVDITHRNLSFVVPEEAARLRVAYNETTGAWKTSGTLTSTCLYRVLVTLTDPSGTTWNSVPGRGVVSAPHFVAEGTPNTQSDILHFFGYVEGPSPGAPIPADTLVTIQVQWQSLHPDVQCEVGTGVATGILEAIVVPD